MKNKKQEEVPIPNRAPPASFACNIRSHKYIQQKAFCV